MYNFYSYEISKILKGAEKIMISLNHPYVGTEHLLLSLMKNDKTTSELLSKYNVTYELFLNELSLLINDNTKKNSMCIYTPLLKRIIKNALEEKNNKELMPLDLLESLLDEGEGIAIRILIAMDVDVDKLTEDIKKKDYKNKSKLEIYNIGKDFNNTVSEDEVVVGRDKEINLIIETLIRKNKNNPLLIGDAGVGKSAIVEELARRINKQLVPDALKNKKIISLEMSSLVAGTKYRGEFEEKLGRIIKEIEENPEIILFIDEIHTMANAGGAEGAINASDILKPYLARGIIKVIGATTISEYNKFILKDKALNRRFELIKISEPNLEETKEILEQLAPSFEKHYNIKITKENVSDIVNLTNRYILDRYNPDKSIDLLDSVCAMKEVESKKEQDLKKLEDEIGKIKKTKEKMVKLNNFLEATNLKMQEISKLDQINELKLKPKTITKEDIKNILYRKCNIPILSDKNKIFDSLQVYLQEKIIGQDDAIKTIIDGLKNHEESSPISFLLTGSTGVGKTKTVKELCQFLKIPLIRLDMSEYNADITINRLIGASAGYVGYDDDFIFNKVKHNPYACILLDEVEKAHPSVLNLFLQILDEGFITSAKGEKIDFSNTYIFMTSNAKFNKNIGFLKTNSTLQNNFSKEFIARISEVINYHDVSLEMLKQYLQKMNITNYDILTNYDYHNLGFRGLDKFLEKNKISIT